MSNAISTERLFTLPSFEGLKLIRTYSAKHPDTDIVELIELIEKIDPDGYSLDLEASAYLHVLVETDCSLDNPYFYQLCIKTLIVEHQPLWAKSMRQGRKRFVQTLNQNDQDVFIAAGLMNDPPSSNVVAWWDSVSGYARLITDIQKMDQARSAERLSLDHEWSRLACIGIAREPVWLGLDDNFAGYDVLSYDFLGNEIVNKMIEVKSTTASPLRFIVTRHEWNQALKIGSAYIFHVWDMTKTPPVLYVRTAEQVAAHIPVDQQDGKWGAAEIPIGRG